MRPLAVSWPEDLDEEDAEDLVDIIDEMEAKNDEDADVVVEFERDITANQCGKVTSGDSLVSSVTFGNTNIPRSELNNNYVAPFSEKTKFAATMASQEVPTPGSAPASTPAMGAISRRTATTTPKKKTKTVTVTVTPEEETVNIR